MMSRQRPKLFLMVSVSLLLFIFTSVQFQAQRLIPPPAAPGQQTVRTTEARDAELLQNGSFEIAGPASGNAANWTGIRLLNKSQRVCNRIGHPTKPDKIVAHDENCAFRFSAEITNIKRVLKQVITAPPGVATDTVEFSYWAAANNVTIKPYAQVTVKYTDKTKKKFKVPANPGSYPYTQFTGGTALTGTVKKIVVKFVVEGGGKLYLDGASLMHSPFEFAPTANDDSVAVSVATVSSSHNVTVNDTLANPAATVASYANAGDIGGVSSVASPGVYTIPDSGGITVSIAANGAMTVDSTAISATTGIYTFDYQLANVAGSDTATVTLSVQVGPIANDDSFVMLVGNPLSGDLNDANGGSADSPGVPPGLLTSFGGGSLGGAVTDNAAGASVALAGGSLTAAGDGTFSLTGTTQTGIFTFQYRLANAAASDDGTVTIEIRAAPAANDDGIYAVNLGGTLNIATTDANDLLDNDLSGFPLAVIASFGGGSLTGDASTNAAGASVALADGTLQVNADGSFSLITPATAGTYTFDYRLSNIVASDDATVTIEVRRVPDAFDDSFNVLVGATLNGVDLNNDNGNGADDPGSPAATLTSFGGGSLAGAVTDHAAGANVPLAGGTLQVNADGTLTLSNTNQTGIFTFSYRLTNAGGTDDAVVTIEIRQAPMAADDGLYVVGTGQTLTVLATDGNDLLDNDNRGFPLANLTSFGGGDLDGVVTDIAAGGTIGLAGGTLQVGTDGSFTLTAPTLAGTYTFQYRITNVVATSDATVTIQVQQSPVAEDDAFIVQINATLTGDLNDDNGNGVDSSGVPPYNSLTFGGGSVSNAVTDHVAPATVILAGGDLTVNLDGTFSVVNPTQTGTFTFQYRLSNAIPASDDATVTIDVRATPVAQDDAGLIATHSTVTSFPAGTLFADNGSDVDFPGVPAGTIVNFGGGSLGGVVSDNAAGATTGAATFAGGTLTVNADGSFSVTNPTQTGDFTFQYRLQNVSGFDDATVTLTIRQAPVAQNDAFTMMVDTTLSGQNLLSDNGSGADMLGYPAAAISSFGGGSLLGTVITTSQPGWTVAFAGGNLTIHANGTFTLLNPTESGVFTIQYRLTNAAGFSDATVTFTIQRAPVAVDDGVYIVEAGDTLTVSTADANDLLDNDMRGYPLATINSYGGGSLGGAVEDNTAGAPVNLASGALLVNADGSFSLTNPTSPGTYTFQYRLTNAAGSSSATVTIEVRQAPVAVDDAFLVQINATLNGDLNDNNGSGADTLGYPAATLTSFGGGSIGGSTLVTDFAAGATTGAGTFAGGTLTVNADGTFSLVNPTQTGVYTFQYRLSNAIPASDDATVTIDVRATPIAQDDTDLIATHGTVTSFPAATLFNDNGNGADFLGVPAAAIVNFGGGSIGGSTLVTDFAAGATTGAGTFAGGTLTVNADGSFSVSNPTQTGNFSFMYRLENASGFDDALVTVTIQRAPAAQPDAFTFLYTADQSAPGSLFADNGSGADAMGFPAATLTHFGGGSLGGTVMDNTAGTPVEVADGLLTVNADGSWSLNGQPFTPGTYTFDYRIENVVGPSTATVTLNIQQQPVAVDDPTYTVISGETLTVPVGTGLLNNDTRGYPQADIIAYGGGDLGGTVTNFSSGTTVSPISGYTGGSITVNPDGSFTFTPPTLPARPCGEFEFSYRIGNGIATDDADVKITVLCAPDAKDDLFNSGFVAEAGGVGLTGSLFADNGSGADDLGYEAATLTGFSAIGGGATSNAAGSTITLADGTLTVNANGSFTVASVSTPGTYTFDYTITNTAGSDTAMVTIVIDEAPRVTSVTPADEAINVSVTGNVVIDFSEPVNIAAGGITLECPAASSIAFAPALPLTNVTTVTVDPTTSLPGNKVCVVTVVSSLVTDVDTIDAPNNLDGDNDGIEGPDFTTSFTTAPVAVDDAYTVTSHLIYDSSAVTPQAFSVRNNDDPADSTTIIGFGATLATADDMLPNGSNSIVADGAGGSVVLNADGTFIFYPDAGVTSASGPATFHYTITGGDTAQVTLTFATGELVWFVDDNAADTVCSATNVGTQACPALAPDTALGTDHTGNDTIFIAEGSYDCQITLKNNVKVIGDGAASTTLADFSGIAPVSGSSFAPYDTFTTTDPVLTSSADCFTLGQNVTVRGLTVGNTTGYAFASANPVGTLTVNDVSITGNGGMFSLTGGGTFNGTFNELSSSAHSNSVINLAEVGGTITHATGTISHADSGSPTVLISGDDPKFTYKGNITKTAGGRVIDIQDTIGDTISFTGTVAQNVAAGTGILIDDQTGGTVLFNVINLGTLGTRMTSAAITVTDGSGTSTVTLGTISVFTDGGHALTVTDHDGTVNVTTASTINALNARAINIDGPAGRTTLDVSLSNVVSSGPGDYGISLADVSGVFSITTLANISNKTDGVLISRSAAAVTIKELDITTTTADAVRLSNNAGSFTITGDGDFAATHTNGAGGSFSSIGDNAFDLNSVSNVQVTDVTVSGTGSHAVTGTGVSGSTIFSNVDMSNIGNANDEHVFDFKQNAVSGSQVSGTLNINNSVITNFTDHGVYLENFSGALTLRITNNTWENNISTTACGGTNCDGNGILLRADGTASMVGLIQNNNINQIDGTAITANPEGNSGATMDLTIRQNTLTANAYAGASNTNNGEIAISLRNQQGNSTLRFDVRENSITNYSGEFAQGIIEVEGGDFTTTHGTIHANTIQHAHFGSPIAINSDGGHTSGSGTTNLDLVVAVTNNTVSGPMYSSALYVLGQGGISGSDANAQITVTGNNFTVSPTASFTRTLMVDFGGYNRGCFNIAGNTIAAGVGGINSIDMYYAGNAVLSLQGMAGSGDSSAMTYLNGANTLAASAYVGDNNTINSAICTTPVAPVLVP